MKYRSSDITRLAPRAAVVAAVGAIAAASGLGFSRAGVRQQALPNLNAALNPGRSSARLLRRDLTPVFAPGAPAASSPPASPSGDTPRSDLDLAGPLPGGPPAPDPDRDTLDNMLVHHWAALLFHSHHPRLQKEDVSAPYIALTFDDGPKPWGTPLILDQLEHYQAHATFFLVGKQCVRFPAIVSRIASDGDEIGNHTYDHYRLPTIPLPNVELELERDRTLIRQLTGQTTYLFRPPGGRMNPQVQTLADSLGYTTVFWRLDSGELQGDMDPDTVYHRVVDNVKSGDIVLLHNGDRNIVLALPHIMETLSKQGYQFVTVSQLMQMTGARPTDDAGGARPADEAGSARIDAE